MVAPGLLFDFWFVASGALSFTPSWAEKRKVEIDKIAGLIFDRFGGTGMLQELSVERLNAEKDLIHLDEAGVDPLYKENEDCIKKTKSAMLKK